MVAPENDRRLLGHEKQAGFAAAVALYPGCATRLGELASCANMAHAERSWSTAACTPPLLLLILIGEYDDWTPAEPCRKLTEAAQRAGYPVRIKIYPGTHHSFDRDRPTRYVGERVNVNSPTGRGATTGGDPKAWADSIGEVAAFFEQNLRQKQD
jgi:dienelactone hydrolase